MASLAADSPPALAPPADSRPALAPPTETPPPPQLAHIAQVAIEASASDAHLSPGQRPWLRIGGVFQEDPDQAGASAEFLERCGRWAGGNDVSFAGHIGDNRWRITAYQAVDGWNVKLRHIPATVPTFDQLGLPDEIKALSNRTDGLVIAAGGTGSGKTTTIAAIITEIIRSREVHLLTIEEPVEYLYQPLTALVTHRELGPDLTPEVALSTAMRSDPDVILYGELRTATDTAMCLRLALSGHLVLTTIHARDCGAVCEKIIADTGPSGRSVLAQVLRAVIVQKLVPDAKDRTQRHLAAEIMLVDGPYRAMLRPEGRITSIETKLFNDRRSLDVALAQMVRSGKISRKDAAERALNDENFLTALGGSA